MTLGWTEPLSRVSGVCTLSPCGEPQGFPVPSEMSLFIRAALLEQSQGGKENLQKAHINSKNDRVVERLDTALK